ncbi:hypothetical protein [Planomicrobium sp. YIM 101495]|uniref:hypothetical protein n=1 Tax=Planomicrobium sp. YIM 101495 TaxID=2665160 RepID=UPI0012B7EEBD|nr:hypothetical protein [Planomicrobium sp. YIM 101495]MTD31918.1 hypothetical protein [Planomicrobium sp. YIM 101495]
MSKISILIVGICLLLIPFFAYQLIYGSGFGSFVYSGSMIALLFVSIGLVISHWKAKGEKVSG